MRSLAAAMSAILLLLALPTMAQSQGTDGEEPESPGRIQGAARQATNPLSGRLPVRKMRTSVSRKRSSSSCGC